MAGIQSPPLCNSMADESKGKEKLSDRDETKVEGVEEGKKSERLDVKIEVIDYNQAEKTGPIIAYFPSGYDPLKKSDNYYSDSDSDSESRSSPVVKFYRSLNPRNPKKPRMQLVMSLKNPPLDFVGTNYSGEAASQQLASYSLGVLDKEKKVLKMIPIAGNRIFRMDPKVPVQPEDETNSEERSLARKRNVTSMYSTEKNIRQDAKYETLHQLGDQTIYPDLERRLKGVKINLEAFEPTIDSTISERNTPPYDLSATSPDMAYPLDKIILVAEWTHLHDVLVIAEAGSEPDPEVYPSFVCNRVHKLKEIKDEYEKRKMACILSYITHLIRFKNRSSTKRHLFPRILDKKFSSMFGETEKKIPDEKQKLLISYVLVLSLFTDEFRSDISDMEKDLHMNFTSLRPHYEYLGCKFVKEKQVLLATLPLPLKFQTNPKKRIKLRV